ncbi:hypothetical protein HYG86_00240 [Alkalicella caledoniensis]|uniref:Uncharacterized protein n=1 Tax=Alkalicella caledoniensis TaxID=2731377 RepID=A0A7G9W3Q4_ALKCA|nr:hypothetical protein [Alkalicella caledoniensis]QNO13316.1 hypothetical protein HYG86_00240 [Alkalicella caledoniensis]
MSILINYIEKCAEYIDSKDRSKAEELVKEVIGVFEEEITHIKSQLTLYGWGSSSVDYFKDLAVLKAILINYKANLKREDDIRKDELEMLKLKQSILNINNTNNNDSSSTATASSSVTVTVTQAIDSINNLPDDTLSNEDKEALEEKIAALEILVRSGDKEKTSKKLGSILKYVVDKGIEVGIALLPYLGEISKMIQAN